MTVLAALLGALIAVIVIQGILHGIALDGIRNQLEISNSLVEQLLDETRGEV